MTAFRELEALTLEREAKHYKQQIALKYAELVYFGLWFTPLREALDGFVNNDAAKCNRLGEVHALQGQREHRQESASEFALYSAELSSFTMGASYDRRTRPGSSVFLACRRARGRHLKMAPGDCSVKMSSGQLSRTTGPCL